MRDTHPNFALNPGCNHIHAAVWTNVRTQCTHNVQSCLSSANYCSFDRCNYGKLVRMHGRARKAAIRTAEGKTALRL